LVKYKGFKTCAGCRALFKTINNGNPFVWCNLDKQMIDTPEGYFDRRLDFEVYKKPIDFCKVKTIKAMVNSVLKYK